MMDRTLYHGSSVIVEQPLASIGRRDLDFGPGFYLTPLREQAERWALRIRTIKNTSHAYLNTYLFHEPDKCIKKVFSAYDKEWLDFIVASRKGEMPWKGFDIVEGGIANDRVIDAVEAYGTYVIQTGLPKAELPSLYSFTRHFKCQLAVYH